MIIEDSKWDSHEAKSYWLWDEVSVEWARSGEVVRIGTINGKDVVKVLADVSADPDVWSVDFMGPGVDIFDSNTFTPKALSEVAEEMEPASPKTWRSMMEWNYYRST